MNNYYYKIIMGKVCKILYNNNIGSVVLSKNLKLNKSIINIIESEGIDILDGRYIFKDLIFKITKYICKIKNENISKCELTLLTNNLNNDIVNNIMYLAGNVKVVNIVTNNIKEYKNLEEKIYEKFGILIRITNNKRKSLASSKLIFNLDFPEEILNEYYIYDRAIIINIHKKIKILSKKFNGININYYNIELSNKYKEYFKKYNIYNNFSNNELLESILYNGKDFYNRIDFLEDNNVIILNLIGENGIINENNIKDIDKF